MATGNKPPHRKGHHNGRVQGQEIQPGPEGPGPAGSDAGQRAGLRPAHHQRPWPEGQGGGEEVNFAELERIEALIERWSNWLIQDRDGSDEEGRKAVWLYLDQLKKQKKVLLAEG